MIIYNLIITKTSISWNFLALVNLPGLLNDITWIFFRKGNFPLPVLLSVFLFVFLSILLLFLLFLFFLSSSFSSFPPFFPVSCPSLRFKHLLPYSSRPASFRYLPPASNIYRKYWLKKEIWIYLVISENIYIYITILKMWILEIIIFYKYNINDIFWKKYEIFFLIFFIF